jgi:hypothetical protein
MLFKSGGVSFGFVIWSGREEKWERGKGDERATSTSSHERLQHMKILKVKLADYDSWGVYPSSCQGRAEEGAGYDGADCSGVHFY